MADVKNDEIKKIDASNLFDKLTELTGHDFEMLEKQERVAGNTLNDVTLSRTFHCRVAAHALGCNPHDIKDLKLPEYLSIVRKVSDFFMYGLEKAKEFARLSEGSPLA